MREFIDGQKRTFKIISLVLRDETAMADELVIVVHNLGSMSWALIYLGL